MNPFTLKELRQLTRSRTIAGGLIVFLCAFLLATYLEPLSGIKYNTGSTLACILAVILLPALSLLLPIDLFVRMMKERRGRNADLTLITPLAPSAIVDGKLRSAFALMFLFSAAALPFGVAAYLLHGVSFVNMFKILALVVGYSCVMVHLAIAIASLRCSPVFRIILFIAQMMSGSPAVILASCIVVPATSGIAWADLIVTLAAMATICLFWRAQAIAWISPKVMERDAPLRLVALVATIGWISYVLLRYWNGEANDLATHIGGATMQFVLLAGWIAANALAQTPGYSHRQRAERPASRWGRVATWLFRSGTINGLAFALLLGLLAACVLPLIAPHVNDLYRIQEVYDGCNSKEFRTVSQPGDWLIGFGYVMAVMMYFRCAWYHLFRKTRVSPALVPVVALMAFAFLQTLPGLMELSGGSYEMFLPFCLSGGYDEHYGYHAIAAAIAFALGLLAMLPEALCTNERR